LAATPDLAKILIDSYRLSANIGSGRGPLAALDSGTGRLNANASRGRINRAADGCTPFCFRMDLYAPHA
jgi:hypothetical protein